MKHRIALAAIAASALIIGACGERDDEGGRYSTEPLARGPGSVASGMHYITTGVAAVRDPHTGQLLNVPPAPSASTNASGSVVAATGTGEAMQFPFSSPGLAKAGGTSVVSFTDDANHHHVLALLYAGIGGPPAAIQHYVDGSLVSTSAYTWQKTPTGWLRTHSLLQVVRNGTLYGTYTTNTVPSKGGGGPVQPVRFDHAPAVGPLQQFIGRVAYGLAFALAPQDASAQAGIFVGPCKQDFLKYSAAAAIVVGITITIGEAPIITPLLISQLISSLALLGATEDLLLDCVIGHFQMFGSSGGSGGSLPQPPPAICLQGSYAPQCSTPFTL
jgi:hypothetical protein